MKKPYHIVSRDAETASATLEEFAKANGQILLPLVELITQARLAVDEVIDDIGRQAIETILNLSAEHVAGARTPGKSNIDQTSEIGGRVLAVNVCFPSRHPGSHGSGSNSGNGSLS